MSMSIDGVELLSLRMEYSLWGGRSTVAVDKNYNVYVDYSPPFFLVDTKMFDTIKILPEVLDVTTERLIDGQYTHSYTVSQERHESQS